MVHALLLAHVVGQVADFAGCAANHDHFGAEVLVEMNVGCGQHGAVVAVLEFDELFGQLALVVVIDKRNGGQSLAVTLPGFMHQAVAYHAAHELGAVGELAVGGQALKLLIERPFN